MPCWCIRRFGALRPPKLHRDGLAGLCGLHRGHRSSRQVAGGLLQRRHVDINCLFVHCGTSHEHAEYAAQRMKANVRLSIVDHKLRSPACCHSNWSIHPRQLAHHGVRCEVGCIHPIRHKIAIVGRVTELAAVGVTPIGALATTFAVAFASEFAVAVNILAQAMIFPFPNEAAGQ